MKKIVSILIAFTVILSAISISTITSFAQEWEDIRNVQDISPYVNEKSGGEFYTEYDNTTQGLTITYSGEGALTDWEFPLLVEGQDYDVLSEDTENNLITIKLLAEGRGEVPYIHALVDFGGETEAVSDTQNEVQMQGDEKTAQNTDDVNSSDNVKSDYDDDFIKDESMEFTADLKSDNSAEKVSSKHIGIVLIVAASGAVVCIVVLLILKIKKSHS